ncbi:MAG: hypothetical protein JSV62_03345 [Promethearchaeota archaeon]|nr:MAG: hypothetical protein JSV62_03345 [Candidatus Lokiarchaeota archaeon]
MKRSLLKKTLLLNTTFLTYLSIFLVFFSSNSYAAVTINIFSDDFEHGTSKWESVTGLWHLTTYISNSPTHSIWFGNESTGNYDMGDVNGSLTSIPIDLSKAQNASLELYHLKETEEMVPFDQTVILISNDSIIWHTLYLNYSNVPAWQKLSFNISAYCGNSTVQIRFMFDTVDDNFNNYIGWLIDDVVIKGLVELEPTIIPSYPIIGIVLIMTLISLLMINKSKKKLNH